MSHGFMVCRRVFDSINGSSGAILAAVSAAVDKGGQILVARELP